MRKLSTIMTNQNLSKAKKEKNDEFYTQYPDIQKEINAYLEYNPNVFRGKTILLPCDDPEWSNFTKFFAQNFENFGLKKLISTSYAVESKKIKQWEPTIFETENPNYDADKSRTNGKIFVLDHDTNQNGIIDIDDLEWKYLEGDGDFRSDEVKKLRDEADIIITNPPFSLFREFVIWLMESEKRFIIIGNQNNISYKTIFPKLMNNEIWLGVTMPKRFTIPKGFEGKNVTEINGVRYQSFGNTCWFTNVEHGRRHQPLTLMSMADNIKFSKHRADPKWENAYKRYDNYNAIHIPFVDSIPNDYEDVMGVPISFVHKYCPEQFEILGITDRGNMWNLKVKEYALKDAKNYSDLNRRGVLFVDGMYKMQFPELLIRKKL